jgi:hypothetical protein
MSLYEEGTDMEQFIHIPSISWYNHNYYIGFDGDLLYGKSDDDGCTEWYKIHGLCTAYLGYSLCSEDECLHLSRP